MSEQHLRYVKQELEAELAAAKQYEVYLRLRSLLTETERLLALHYP